LLYVEDPDSRGADFAPRSTCLTRTSVPPALVSSFSGFPGNAALLEQPANATPPTQSTKEISRFDCTIAASLPLALHGVSRMTAAIR
jgi:hypothetical protein